MKSILGAALASLLLTLGALSAVIGIGGATCTGGVADSLAAGGIVTSILYAAGFAALVLMQPPRASYLALLPATIVAIWHTAFAIRFAWGFWLHDMSACYAMVGGFTPANAGQWMDGREPIFICLWLLLSLMYWIGLIFAFRRTPPRHAALAT